MAKKSAQQPVFNKKAFLAAFGSHVRQAREKKGLTQKQLAEEAGLAPAMVSAIERGLHEASLNSAARLACALGLRLFELTKGL